MNADSLLALYDRVADAPDAIPRLRRFVLDLAVRGKLVDQNPAVEVVSDHYSDEPALEAYPESWRSLNFGRFCDIQGGNQPPKSQFVAEPRQGYVRLLQIRDLGEKPVPTYIPKVSTKRFCTDGEILIGRYGASVGKIFWAQNGAYNVALAKFLWPEDALSSTFVFLLLTSAIFQNHVLSLTRSAQAGFNKGDLATIDFPLPPLAEQHRIVAKVDELMALCDRLEAARAEREAARDRLAAATLARLNAPDSDPAAFQAHAAFALKNLAPLTARPDQIKTLRQTILNLAVRGKLVEQDPADEPASELLKRIAAEKTRLVKAGEIGPSKPIVRTGRQELVFRIPPHWEPLKCSEILDELQTGPFGSSLHKSDYVVGGTPVINPASLQNERIVPLEKMAVGRSTLERLASFKLRLGDIVMARRGEMGRCALVTDVETGWLCGTGSLILRPSKLLYAPFLVLLIGSPFSRDYLGGSAVGATMQNLNQSILLNLPFGLPPLAEQHRIVAKVDELMALCNRLEAAIATADTNRARILEALLHEALIPADEPVTEAAE